MPSMSRHAVLSVTLAAAISSFTAALIEAKSEAERLEMIAWLDCEAVAGVIVTNGGTRCPAACESSPASFVRHVLGDEQDVIDSRADGLLVGRDDKARYRVSRRHSLVSDTDHRIAVVGYENPVLRRGPSQDLRVGRAFGQRILGTHQVDL